MTALSITAHLNDRWRAEDDGLQWILAVRRGRMDAAGTKWGGRRFHRCRTPLIHSIGELCGPVDPGALAIIRAFPEQYGQPRNRGAHLDRRGQRLGGQFDGTSCRSG